MRFQLEYRIRQGKECRHLQIRSIRHAWPERAGFGISHPADRCDYIFIHFNNSVELCIGGGETVVTKPNACIFFDSRSSVYFKSHPQLIHDWMHICGDVREFIGEYGLECDKLYYPKNCGFVTEIVKEMELEFFSKKSNWEKLCDLKFGELVIKLSRSMMNEETALTIPGETAKRFTEIRMKVFSDLSKNWEIEELAKMAMLSPSRFYCVYKELFGISPKNDLICARVGLAKNLLLSKRYTVEGVAAMTGYTNICHFIRQFKKYTGKTPGDFIK